MFCPHCGKDFPAEANFCPVCGKPPLSQQAPYRPTRIVRPRQPRMIAGVCAGFALYYGWDLAVTRIAFAVVTFFTAIPALFYIAAWILMPDAPYELPQTTRTS